MRQKGKCKIDRTYLMRNSLKYLIMRKTILSGNKHACNVILKTRTETLK